MALNFPLTAESADCDAGRRHGATVDERRIAADPNESAPRPNADEWPEFFLAEVPRQRVATRACELVDEHHLRAIDREWRIDEQLPISALNHAMRFAAQIVDDVVGDLAPVIEAFVDNHACFAHLREEVAVEIREAAVTRVRKVHVGEFSAAHLVDFPTIIFDPIEIA